AAQEYFLESPEAQRQRVMTAPPSPRPANQRKVDELPWQRLRVAELERRYDAVEELFTDLPFLEAAAEGGMVFDLVTDFATAVAAVPVDRPPHRILRLLQEAIRADVHFLACQPTT